MAASSRGRVDAGLGERLFRLSAAMHADASGVYAAHGITFEHSWFGLVDELARAGPSNVGQLARRLGLSRASVNEARRALEDHRLVVSRPDPDDADRRLLYLSPRGATLVRELRVVRKVIEDAEREIEGEVGGAHAALEDLERALARKPLAERVAAVLDRSGTASPPGF